MGEIARTGALPRMLDFRGKCYPLAPSNYEVRGQYELWLERRALARVALHRGHVDEQVYQEYVTTTTRDINSCSYSWGTETCQKSLVTPPGWKHLTFLCFKKAQTADSPDVNPALIDQMFEDEAFSIELGNAIRDLNADPNRQAPALEPGNP